MAKFCPGVLWSIIWCIILWFIMWPIAGLLAGLYIFLLPISACVPALKDICNTLLEWIQWCEKLGHKIKNMDEVC